MKQIIVGVMGPGREATEDDIKNAEILGQMIAENGWLLLNGGKNQGVMEAVSKGAKSKGGMVIGISSSQNKEDLTKYVDIPIITGMGSARNNINVLSSDVVVACGLGLGTISEIVLASKAGKKVILLTNDKDLFNVLKKFEKGELVLASTPHKAVEEIRSAIVQI